MDFIKISCFDTEVPENYDTSVIVEDDLPRPRKVSPEPIKDLRDIDRISRYFIERGQLRDNMLFICGINFGLRCGDLLKLRFHKLITGGKFRESFEIIEEKTNKRRVIGINGAVRKAVAMYLNENDRCGSDYMFTSESAKESNRKPKPLAVSSVERILKEAAKALGLDMKIATHTLRKTFAYHTILQAPDRTRSIELLQKIFGHASQTVTLAYAGITDEEITNMYKQINLGLSPSAGAELIPLYGNSHRTTVTNKAICNTAGRETTNRYGCYDDSGLTA